MTKKYARPHEYRVACQGCHEVTVVHARIKRPIKRCPRCGAKRPLITVTFLQTNSDPMYR
jgi:ribosomal protein S27E